VLAPASNNRAKISLKSNAEVVLPAVNGSLPASEKPALDATSFDHLVGA
jgi:hypothetical protein